MKRVLSRLVSIKSILGLVISVAVVSTLSVPVHAASIYDDDYHATSTLTVKSGNCTEDISTDWMNHLGSYTSSFQSAVSWGVSELPRYGVDGTGNVTEKAVIVYWNTSQQMATQWNTWGYIVASPATSSVILQASCSGGVSTITVSNYGTGYISSDDGAVTNFFFKGTITSPDPGYEGPSIVTFDDVDQDGDDLTNAQEADQGTSDTLKDTDGDGLSDFTESSLNPDRDDLFCGTSCAYPDPTQKDLYVEVDWMKDPVANESFKPTSTQLDQVESAYLAQGIHAHFDTGAYGGGNELSSYTPDLYFAPTSSHVDFYDYKNGSVSDGISSNFDHDRYHIWHYMISGYQYHDITGSSGVSYAGDDDSFISYGLIEHNPFNFAYADFDIAIAGTVIHELGHDSCLSQTAAYTNQPSGCVYSGVDAAGPSTYASSMNYDLQMYIVDYSTGANGTSGDHDDWSAVNGGMGDFALSSQGAEMSGKKMTGRMRVGITLQKAKELRSRGQLGLIKKHGITRSLLPNRFKSPLVN